jgi:hypothetical protein
MPVNITQGNSAQFIAAFLDANGNVTVPSSAPLTIVYTTVANSTASTTLAMTLSGEVFTATWASSVAAFGFANWSVIAAGQAQATTGQLRLLDP